MVSVNVPVTVQLSAKVTPDAEALVMVKLLKSWLLSVPLAVIVCVPDPSKVTVYVPAVKTP